MGVTRSTGRGLAYNLPTFGKTVQNDDAERKLMGRTSVTMTPVNDDQ